MKEIRLKMKVPLIEIHVDLPATPTMELVPSLTAISLRSPNVYDLWQVFLRRQVRRDQATHSAN